MQNSARKNNYKVQRISELLSLENGELYFSSIVEDFKSPNKDVENFLKAKLFRFLPCALALFISTLPVFSQPKSIDDASKKLVKEIMENEMVTVIHAKGRMGMENFAGTEGIQIINAYQIAKHEVTQELYTAVMGENPSYFKDNPASDQLNDVGMV